MLLYSFLSLHELVSREVGSGLDSNWSFAFLYSSGLYGPGNCTGIVLSGLPGPGNQIWSVSYLPGLVVSPPNLASCLSAE